MLVFWVYGSQPVRVCPVSNAETVHKPAYSFHDEALLRFFEPLLNLKVHSSFLAGGPAWWSSLGKLATNLLAQALLGHSPRWTFNAKRRRAVKSVRESERKPENTPTADLQTASSVPAI
jgi:hypothetical protein